MAFSPGRNLKQTFNTEGGFGQTGFWGPKAGYDAEEYRLTVTAGTGLPALQLLSGSFPHSVLRSG